MFILSNSIPKSGSTLFMWLQREVLKESIFRDGQVELTRNINENLIDGIGNFVNNIEDQENLDKLLSLSEIEGPFIVKGHSILTKVLKDYIDTRQIIVTFIHRDPRDIILSIIDHGKRENDIGGAANLFSQFKTVQETIPFVKKLCHTALQWINSGCAEIFTYEELLQNTRNELLRFLDLLNQKSNNNYINKAINAYTEFPIPGKRQFNTGKLTRFREEMTPQEIDLCNQKLKDYLIGMDYKL